MNSPQTLILVFAAPSFAAEPAALQVLAAQYPQSTLVGCSTAGEIYGAKLCDASLAVALVRFEHTALRLASAPISCTADSDGAGRAMAAQLAAPELRAVLVLSEGTHVNGSALVRGLTALLPPAVVITGGLAGDGARFGPTWVWQGGAPRTGWATAVGLYGAALQVGYGSRGGWDIFGPERRITRSAGNVLYELDGRPALQLYKEYLGERAAGLPATALLFPLALRLAGGAEPQVVRTVLAIDEAAQSMQFAGDVPEGAFAQLMRANFDRLIEAAADAGQHSRIAANGPVLSVAISCVGRRLILGERSEEELEATLEALPPSSQQIGFYSYGELSPSGPGSCELHNQTMTLTTFSEGAPDAPAA